jgi:hypothetical protein
VTFQRVGCEDLSHKPPSHEILPKSWANDLQFLVLATGAESNVSGAEAADEEDAGGEVPGNRDYLPETELEGEGRLPGERATLEREGVWEGERKNEDSGRRDYVGSIAGGGFLAAGKGMARRAGRSWTTGPPPTRPQTQEQVQVGSRHQ